MTCACGHDRDDHNMNDEAGDTFCSQCSCPNFRDKNESPRSKKEMLHLAGGDSVPKFLVDALDELERVWPGATLRQARPAIIATILKAQKLK